MEGVTKRLRIEQNAVSSGASQVAPVARSVCAILMAAGVKDEHLDGVMAILSDGQHFPPEDIPHNFLEIATQVRRAHQIFLDQIAEGVRELQAIAADED